MPNRKNGKGTRKNKALKNKYNWGFPGGAVVKNPPANAGDKGSSQIGRASCRERV